MAYISYNLLTHKQEITHHYNFNCHMPAKNWERLFMADIYIYINNLLTGIKK